MIHQSQLLVLHTTHIKMQNTIHILTGGLYFPGMNRLLISDFGSSTRRDIILKSL